jgi:hypothetical protein
MVYEVAGQMIDRNLYTVFVPWDISEITSELARPHRVSMPRQYTVNKRIQYNTVCCNEKVYSLQFYIVFLQMKITRRYTY